LVIFSNVLKHLVFFFKCFKTLDFFIFEEIKNFKCSTTFDFFFDTTFEFLVGCGGLWQQQNSCEFHPGFYQNSSRNRWPRNFIEILQGFLLFRILVASSPTIPTIQKSFRDFDQNSGIVMIFYKDFDQNSFQELHDHGIVTVEIAVTA